MSHDKTAERGSIYRFMLECVISVDV